MVNVDYRQLMQQYQKLEGELKQEMEKTKALRSHVDDEIHKRNMSQSDLKNHSEEISRLKQREQQLLTEVAHLKDLKKVVEEDLYKLRT